MGSYNMSCAVSGVPLDYRVPSIIIPLYMKQYTKRNIYPYDNVCLFPYFVKGTHDDGSSFKVIENDISNELLGLIQTTLESSNKSEENDFLEDTDNLTWKNFFEICHEGLSLGYGRLSYCAIDGNLFNQIIDEFTLSDEYDSERYGWHEYFRDEKEKLEKTFLEKGVVHSSLASVYQYNGIVLHKSYINNGYRDLANQPDIHQLMLDQCKMNDRQLENTLKICYFNYFLMSINCPWSESVYAGQEFNQKAFGILANHIKSHLE